VRFIYRGNSMRDLLSLNDFTHRRIEWIHSLDIFLIREPRIFYRAIKIRDEPSNHPHNCVSQRDSLVMFPARALRDTCREMSVNESLNRQALIVKNPWQQSHWRNR